MPVAPHAEGEFRGEAVEQAYRDHRGAYRVIGVAAVASQELELHGLDPGFLEPGPHNVPDDGSAHALASFVDILCWSRSHRRPLLRSQAGPILSVVSVILEHENSVHVVSRHQVQGC